MRSTVPTCDKSGECYLQDNTYLHNIHANPIVGPSLPALHPLQRAHRLQVGSLHHVQPLHAGLREMIGVTAIEGAYRGLEATIAPAYGEDLTDTLCTSCGMCIAVCPVGALTDRHFGHHPWELDTTETICGF